MSKPFKFYDLNKKFELHLLDDGATEKIHFEA